MFKSDKVVSCDFVPMVICSGISSPALRSALILIMVLSDTDIDRIKSLGFSRDFFVDIHNGWLQLKNRDGRCVFHNGIKCSIYDHRPEGCQLYPVIFDKDNNCAILDEECPYRTKFLITQILRKKLFLLVSRIESDRFQRMNNYKD